MLDLKKIAVIGPPSCGKSTVCRFFKDFGAYIVDCDAIVALLLKQKQVIQKILEEIGFCLDDERQIDKVKLAKLVFESPDKRKKLESILHPLVLKEIKTHEAIASENHYSLFVVEIPLLFTLKEELNYDAIIYITCTKEIAKRRWNKGNDFDIRWQLIEDSMKEGYFHYTIINNSTTQLLKEEVKKIYQILTN